MSIPAVTAPFLASTALLGIAGAAKVVRPADTARALQLAGLRASRWGVRAGAGAEIVIAVAALTAPGALTGALVATSYLAFAVFVAIALHRGWPLSTCGCFGRRDSVPSRSHVALDLAAALSAALWASGPPGDLWRALSSQPWGGWPLVLVSLLLSLTSYLVWTNPLVEARAR